MTPERIGALITELQNGVPPNKEEIGLIFGSISRPRRAQLLFMEKLFLLCRRGRISSSEEETLLNLSEASDPDPLLSRLGSLVEAGSISSKDERDLSTWFEAFRGGRKTTIVIRGHAVFMWHRVCPSFSSTALPQGGFTLVGYFFTICVFVLNFNNVRENFQSSFSLRTLRRPQKQNLVKTRFATGRDVQFLTEHD